MRQITILKCFKFDFKHQTNFNFQNAIPSHQQGVISCNMKGRDQCEQDLGQNTFQASSPPQNKKTKLSAAQESSADRKRRNIAKFGQKSSHAVHESEVHNPKKQNYNSQPKPLRPNHDQIMNQLIPDKSAVGNVLSAAEARRMPDNVSDQAFMSEGDLKSKIKRMSHDQILEYIMRDPEILGKFKESLMVDTEKEGTSGGYVMSLEDIMPINQLEFDGAHQVDPCDPSIIGNEFEVPQEKTLNTEDFAFTGLPAHQEKPRLYIGPQEGYSDSVEQSIEATGRQHFKFGHETDVIQNTEHCYSISSEVGRGKLNLDNLQAQQESSSDPDCDMAFQSFDEGEVINASLSQNRFIGIHRMQSINSPDPQTDIDGNQLEYQMPFSVNSEDLKHIFGSGAENEEEQEQYMCPVTGAHFHKADLFQRILKLKKRRALIDLAIAEETRQQERQVFDKAEKYKDSSKQQQKYHQIQNNGPIQVKNGRNKSNQLVGGHGERQNLTDGNQRVIKQKIQKTAGVAEDSITHPQIKFRDASNEDEQAVIVNAGKAKKYKSNREVYDVVMAAPGQTLNSAGGVAIVKIGGTKIQNQVSSKSFLMNQQSKPKSSQTNQNDQRKQRSQGRTAAAAIIQQKQTDDQSRNEQQQFVARPPHEQLLQFAASSGQYNVVDQQSAQMTLQKDLPQDQHHKKSSSQSAARTQAIKKRSRDASTVGNNLQQTRYQTKQTNDLIEVNKIDHSDLANPLAYYSHDSRRQATAGQLQQQTQQQFFEKKYQQRAPGTNNSTQVDKMNLQEDHDNSAKRNRGSNIPASQRQSQVYQSKYGKQTTNQPHLQVHAAGSQTNSHGNAASTSADKKNVGKKIESVSFDHRKYQNNNEQTKSIDQNVASVAYRSFQDPRNFQQQHQTSQQHPHNQLTTVNQYQSQGHTSRGSSKKSREKSNQLSQQAAPMQPPTTQLVGLKSSQIEPRVVSKISIQKAKLRQKQMVSAALHSAKAQVVKTSGGDESAQCMPFNFGDQNRKTSNQAQSFDSAASGSRNIMKSLTVASANTQNQAASASIGHVGTDTAAIHHKNAQMGNTAATARFTATNNSISAGVVSRQQKKNSTNAATLVGDKDKLTSSHAQSQQAQNQAAAGAINNHASQIEQVEQFYAMLSGHQVLFGRPNHSQQSMRGNNNGGKDANGKQGGAKPQQGTHARTNTFDNRAAAKVNNAVKMVVNAQKGTHNQIRNTTSLTQKLQQQINTTIGGGNTGKTYQNQQATYHHSQYTTNKPAKTHKTHVRHLSGDDTFFKSKWEQVNNPNITNSNPRYNEIQVAAPAEGQRAKSKSGANQPVVHQRPTTAVIKQSNVVHNKTIRNKSSMQPGRNHPQSSTNKGYMSTSNVVVAPQQANKQKTKGNPQVVQKVSKGGNSAAENSQLNQIQTPQASSQRNFVPNKNQMLAFRQVTGNGNQQTYLVTDQSLQQHTAAAATGQDHVSKSYNSVPLKSKNPTNPQPAAQQSLQVGMPQANPNFQHLVYRLETDRVSDSLSQKDDSPLHKEFFLDNASNKNDNTLLIASPKQQQQQQIKPASSQMTKKVVTKTSKHRKSNSLGYKVVIGNNTNQNNISSIGNEAGPFSYHHELNHIKDQHSDAAFALFKTFNEKKRIGVLDQNQLQQQNFTSQADASNLPQQHQRQAAAAAGQTQSINNNPQKQIIQQQQHRRNASMYYPSGGPIAGGNVTSANILSQDLASAAVGVQKLQNAGGSAMNHHLQPATSQGGGKHKKSHSVSHNTRQQQSISSQHATASNKFHQY